MRESKKLDINGMVWNTGQISTAVMNNAREEAQA